MELNGQACPYLQSCFDDGLLLRGNYKSRAGERPANLVALTPGSFVQSRRGALLSGRTLRALESQQTRHRQGGGRPHPQGAAESKNKKNKVTSK